MTHRIHLVPSGHEFDCEPGETLLEAALRSGLNLNHGCLSGTCGACKARIVSGRIGAVEFHDYVLTEAEKLRGCTLMCRSRPASDLTVEATEAYSAKDIPRQTVGARITRLEGVPGGHYLLQVRTPRTRTFRFLAGQYADVVPEANPGLRLPIASCPCNGMILQFHLWRNSAEPVDDKLLELLQPGAAVTLDGPFGSFNLAEDVRRPMLMVAIDTGFAPVKSLLEHAFNLDWPHPVCLYWAVGPGGDHYLDNYCRAWADAMDQFSFRPRRLAAGDEYELRGLMRGILEEMSDLHEREVYLAGPRAATGAMAALLSEAGILRERLHVDTTGRDAPG